MDVLTYAVLNKKVEEAKNVFDEKISESVNAYLDKNPPTTGATAEQAAQINKNVTDIDELKSDLVGLKSETALNILSANQIYNKMLFEREPFSCILTNGQIRKPVWYIGDKTLIDAAGAVLDLEIDRNFTYKIILTQDNQKVFIPVTSNFGEYDMSVDWGDGTIETKKGSFNYSTVYHVYSGKKGNIYTIILRGTIPALLFGMKIAIGDTGNLYSVENNTLDGEMHLSFRGSTNLISVSSNTFSNCQNGTESTIGKDVLSFEGCVKLKNIGKGLAKTLKNINRVIFSNTAIETIDDDFFENLNLTSANSIFRNTKLKSIPSSLKHAIKNADSFYYAFAGTNITASIQNDFFEEVITISDIRSCFAGGNKSSITGDAKILYDSVKGKITTNNYGNCFSNNMNNRDKVPVAWGGTMK